MEEYEIKLIKEIERIKKENKGFLIEELKFFVRNYNVLDIKNIEFSYNELEQKLKEYDEVVLLNLLKFLIFTIYIKYEMKLDKALTIALSTISFFSQEKYYNYLPIKCLFLNLMDIYIKKDPELMSFLVINSLEKTLESVSFGEKCNSCIKNRLANIGTITGDLALYNKYNDDFYEKEHKIRLAKIHCKKGNFKKAIKILDSVNRYLFSSDVEFQYLYAKILKKVEDFDSAFRYIYKAKKLIKTDTPKQTISKIYYLSGLIELEKNNLIDGLKDIEYSYHNIRLNGFDRFELKLLKKIISLKKILSINSKYESDELEKIESKITNNEKQLKKIFS